MALAPSCSLVTWAPVATSRGGPECLSFLVCYPFAGNPIRVQRGALEQCRRGKCPPGATRAEFEVYRGKDGNRAQNVCMSFSFLPLTTNFRLYSGCKMRQRIIVLPNIQKRCRVVRGATTEDIEAEKELIEEDALERMEKTLETVKGNFNTVRTGRASPALLDRVEVEYYGTSVVLKSIAQVSTPDGSSLLIQPFDKSSLSAIEKAISKSDVGLTPSNDGNCIRLFIPPLTAERRKELLKMVNKLSEEGKIAIRNIRRDSIKSYEKLEKEKKLSEDNVKDLSASMQKLTDDYVKKIDGLFKEKEKELLTV